MFLVDGNPVLALVSGSNQLDEAKLAAASAGTSVARADAGQVRAATGFSIGGVPPLGHALTVYVDRDLLRYPEVWAAAGTPRDVFGVDPEKLQAAVAGVVADLAMG